MGKRKHRRGNKPTITGRIAVQHPIPPDMQQRPKREFVPIGIDFGAIEARIVTYYGGRRVGKLERLRQTIAALGPDRPIEPLGAGLSRILSRGAAQPVRYPRGG